jgi:hypothetical protein
MRRNGDVACRRAPAAAVMVAGAAAAGAGQLVWRPPASVRSANRGRFALSVGRVDGLGFLVARTLAAGAGTITVAPGGR